MAIEASSSADRKRLPQLDGLRGMAALLVVAAHFNPAPLSPSPGSASAAVVRWLAQLSVGNLAVTFFFALSAFLLTWLLCREFTDTGTISLRRFYARRCLRIWPLYFVTVSVALAISAHPDRSSYLYPQYIAVWLWLRSHLWLYLTFVSNWSLALIYIRGHLDPSPGTLRILWSIGVEEQFYLIHPLLVLFALRKPKARLWLIIGLAALGLGFRLAFTHIQPVRPIPPTLGGLYYSSPAYCEVFLAGAIAGWSAAFGHSLAGFFRPIGWVLPAVCLGLGWLWHNELWYPYGTWSSGIYPFLGAAFAFVIFWFYSFPQSRAAKLTGSAPFRGLGRISYGIYMWHGVAGTLLVQFFWPAAAHLRAIAAGGEFAVWMRFLLTVATTLGFACLSYLVIERPFLRLKRHFR